MKALEIAFWLLLGYANALTYMGDGPVPLRAAGLLALMVCVLNAYHVRFNSHA